MYLSESFLEENRKYAEIYCLLSNKKRKIFDILQWWSRTFCVVYPKQETIADYAGCSRKHVNKTLQEFEMLGLLTKVKRGFNKSCHYFLPKSLRHLDMLSLIEKIKEHMSLKFKEVTREVTRCLLNTLNFSRILGSKAPKKDPISLESVEIPLHIQAMQSATLEQRQKLSIFPKDVMYEAVKSCKKSHENGIIIADEFKYLFSVCKKICEKRKIKPNWKLYYSILDAYKRD